MAPVLVPSFFVSGSGSFALHGLFNVRVPTCLPASLADLDLCFVVLPSGLCRSCSSRWRRTPGRFPSTPSLVLR